MIIIKKLLLFFCIFFLFDTLEIDSNNTKVLMYDKKNVYIEDNFKIYFYNTNSIELEKVISKLNIRILSYIIDGKKYYARDINDLFEKYTSNKKIEEKIYYEKYGIKIDGINVVCQISELIKLENIIHFY